MSAKKKNSRPPASIGKGSDTASNRAKRRQDARQAAEAALEEKRRAAAEATTERRNRRKSKTEATKAKNTELRDKIKAKGIPLPVRVEFAEEIEAESVAKSGITIQVCGSDIYLVLPAGAKHHHKVQLKGEMWTCSCKGWTNRRKIDCKHIGCVLEFRGEGAPYSSARRRPNTVIIYEKNEIAEHTRRQHAYLAWPTRCPEIFEELCKAIEEPLPKNKNGEGAPPIPLKVRAYALLTKAEFCLTYAELSSWLANDLAVHRLGWYKTTPLSVSSLHTICGDSRLLPELKKMITSTADTGRQIETTAIIDASGLPNSVAGNYLDEKYGKKRKRKGGKYLKPHWVQGRVTNLIPYFDLTLDHGVGSGDAPHLSRVLRATKAVWPCLKHLLADAAYGNDGNYKKAKSKGITLFTREKVNEDRSTWGGQAAEIADMQRNSKKQFQEIMRSRSRGETPPARVKGRQPFQRLRRRTVDGPPILPEKPAGDESLCDLPDEELDPILDMAADAVGVAQANEAYAMIVAANTREIVMLENLHDHRMSLQAHTAFHPMRIVHEDELGA
jgi:hypothetical protein